MIHDHLVGIDIMNPCSFSVNLLHIHINAAFGLPRTDRDVPVDGIYTPKEARESLYSPFFYSGHPVGSLNLHRR